MDPIRLYLAQATSQVGAVEQNCAQAIQIIEQARANNAQIVVLPELFLSGYPPEDLLFMPGMAKKIAHACKVLADVSQDVALLIGAPWYQDGQIYNGALWLCDGRLEAVYRKQHLPNYGVFDERRYFSPGDEDCVLCYRQYQLQIMICEDIWQPEASQSIRENNSDMVIAINASPFHVGRLQQRYEHLSAIAQNAQTPIAYINLCASQDELVFDGGSMVFANDGRHIAQARQFQPDAILCEVARYDNRTEVRSNRMATLGDDTEQLFMALVTGLRGYVRSNGFESVVLGLSGGIDSALTLAIACAALGQEHVETIMMPYSYTSTISVEDAKQVAANFGVQHKVIAIEQPVQAFIDLLLPELGDSKNWLLTLQNIQARSRGMILMACANAGNKLVLATGNKSETAVGYSTLYGDMVGGYSVLKDVTKTWVYKLAQYCNRNEELIPERIINRPPSAELMPDQKDSDTLPPYAILDAILEGYVEQQSSLQELGKMSDAQAVETVLAMIDRSEYKRRQAAPGTKVTVRAFGKDRRMPISNNWQH